MKKILLAFLTLGLGFLGGMQPAMSQSSPTCEGKFPNPITDICWSCVLPLKVGHSKIMSMDQEDNDSSPGDLLCYCSNAGVPKVGLTTSFFEPSRLAEVVRSPYCFPSLGGVTIDFGIDVPAAGNAKGNTGEELNNTAFYQAHWYTNPLMFWLEVLLDNFCLENGVFDLAHLTELDFLWADSITSFIINPDVTLFANPVAQAACAVDCVAATAGFPLNKLFWCAGCQGPMYPLTGWVGAKVGGVQTSVLLVQRLTNKLHRQGEMWAAQGERGQCGYYPQPVMDKTAYKMQMLYPTPNTKKINGRCCQPFGRSSVIWGAGKEFPYKGEDFSYQIFRKRDCCAGNLISAAVGG